MLKIRSKINFLGGGGGRGEGGLMFFLSMNAENQRLQHDI